MLEITNIEYFKRSILSNYLKKLQWYYSVFTIAPTASMYVNIQTNMNKYIVYLDNQEYIISNRDINEPILNIQDTIEIDGSYVENLDTTISTTIGRAIFNKIILAHNFKDKIPYINHQVDVGYIEKEIAKRMFNTDIITVDEYLSYTRSCDFFESLSRITNISATIKSIRPPDGIEEFKNKTIKEFNEKYGNKWVEDRVKIVEFENALKNYDNEYLKDDPSNDKLISGKIKNNARTKMYLTLGAEIAFDKVTDKPILVKNSLNDGYPKDKKEIAHIFNTSKSGSYSRGSETQKGGAIAKELLRSISGIVIVDGDCGSLIGKEIKVTENLLKSLNGRYIIENNQVRAIKDFTPYLNKTIMVRSPMYCKSNIPTSICSICAGEILSQYKDIIPLMVNNISTTILISSMKMMHNATVKSTTFNIKENIT